MKTSITAVILSLLAVPALSDETVFIQVYGQNINCGTPVNDQSSNQVMFLENYFDALQTQLPAALPIVETTFWWDGGTPIPSSVSGNVTYALDPGKQYVGLAGYPYTQMSWPLTFKSLGQWLPDQGARKQRDRYWPPINYRIGQDGLVMATECPGAGVIDNPSLTFGYVSDGDIPQPPAANYLLNIPSNALTMTSSTVPYTLRSQIPAPSVAVTSIRVHILWPEYNGAPPIPPIYTKVSGVSVGMQSGNTSSTIAPPTVLPFHLKSAWTFHWRQPMWTNCVDFNSPAGQRLLVSVSLDQSTNGYTFHDGLGSPSWYVQDASQWDDSVLSGTIGMAPNRTYAIDRVQINCK